MPPSVPRTTGVLMMIGGAEDKLGRRTILGRFVRLAGGPDARVAVISTASSLGAATTELYRAVLGRLGVHDIRGPLPLTRAEADSDEVVDTVEDATGVFLTGGNQQKLSSVVAGTRLGDAITAAYQRGAVIAGTSAGASAQSRHMVAFGAPGDTPKQRMAQLSAGLGLIEGVVVDQHFEQRNRIGRLLAVVAASPSLLGLGIDEDTAAVITAGRLLEVLGRGAVTVVDGSRIVTDAPVAKRTDALLVSGVILHSLPAGARFDLVDRELLAARGTDLDTVQLSAVHAGAEPASAAASSRLVGRVAAEGADDTVVERNARRRERRRLERRSVAAGED